MRTEKAAAATMRDSSGRPSSFGQKLTLFLLVIVAGYNTYETMQLKAEVAALRGTRHSSGAASDASPSSLFEQARSEIGQAQARLHLKDYGKARADLQQGVASLERANVQAHAEGEKVLAELRTAARSLQDKTIPPASPSRDPAGTESKDAMRKTERASQ